MFQAGDTIGVDTGGTGATTAIGARTNLGLTIGTDVQAWDADLDAVAALSGTGFAVRTASNTWAQRTLAQPAAGLTITNGDGVSGNPTFALANDLSALEGLGSTGFAVRSASDTWVQRSVATASSARITVSNGDGVSGNPTLDLATLSDGGTGTFLKFTRDTYGRVSGTTAVVTADITALVDATYVNVAGDTMTNFLTLHADPTSAMHAVTKQYADSIAQGMTHKDSVRVASTANQALSGGTAFPTIDGVVTAAGDRVLLKNQSAGAENGLYVVGGTGAAWTLTRTTDADVTGELTGGDTVWVNEGTAQADTGWTITTDGTITLGTTAITWTQTSGLGQVTAGAGLSKSGNTLTVGTASSARIVVNADDIDLATLSDGGTGTFLKFTRDAYGRVSGTTAVVAGDISALLDADLTSIAGLGTTGILVRSASDTYVHRSLTAPAAGITISNNTGTAGNPTFALANDLAALEGLASTGFAVRSTTDTWVQRSVAGTSGRINVTNGDGVSGNPTIDLPTGVNTSGAGTYNSVTVDTYGRVTSGTVATINNDANVVTLTNAQGSTINIGQVVYSSSSGSVTLARSDSLTTSNFIGLVSQTTIGNGATGTINIDGLVTATTTQWDAVTGQSGGLTPNTTYYLSGATAGMMTTTAPTTGHLVPVGVGISTTQMKLFSPDITKL